MRRVGYLLAMFALSTGVRAAEIKFAPGDSIFLNRANDRGMYDIVLHTVGFATNSQETFLLKRLRIEVMKDGAPVLIKYVQPARMVEETSALTSGPERVFLPGQLLAANGVREFFGRDVVAATRARLGPSQFLITTRHHFSVDFIPDEIRVTAEGDDKTAPQSIPVRVHRSSIAYHMPLDGAWAMHALPMLASHHRLNPSTEFAVDFFKTDGEGRNVVGDPLSTANSLGYGASVKAAAAGEVVFVISEDVQDRQTYLRHPGEDQSAYGARISAWNMQRFSKDLRRAAAGNIVTLKHVGNDGVEYSSYGHLKAGSVRVHLGDHVDQDQVIGEVGDTGDSPAVHLHFQLNAGPDAFTSKSLPVAFSDTQYVGSSGDPALFVTNGKYRKSACRCSAVICMPRVCPWG